jgi:hypothetical protein
MKHSKEQTYKLSDLLPAYNLEEWMQTYKQFYVYCIANPDALKKHDDFAKLVASARKLLKANGYKFI